MELPTLDENSVVGVGLNRFKESLDDVKLVAMYRDGRRTDGWERHLARDVLDEILHLTTAWGMLGVRPQDCVAIMAQNRPRWFTTVVSLLARNAITVPVYPTLTAEEAAFILRDSRSRYLVVDTLDQARRMLSVFEELPDLERLFVMDPLADRTDSRVGAYDDLIAMAEGRVDVPDIIREARKISGEDAVVIVYTSGTTGRPKGVILTNGNYLSQQVALVPFGFTPDDVFLNHLPFSHSFGLTADLFGSIAARSTLAIANGMAPEDIRYGLTTIRPTVLMSVPRLFEKIYVQVQQVVSEKSPRVQRLFNAALDVGKAVFDLKSEGKRIPAGLALKHLAARRITTKIRREAGLDRVRVAYAGGAPTSLELCYFYQSLGINIHQGYGLTETSPIANVNLPGRNKLGTVGPPIPGVEEKIAEDGEVLIRGPNVMKGYHNDPEATAEAIDEDGWFHTGDIGVIEEGGYLRIVDRKKELIITSGGKNIAPQPIETAFNTEVCIERVVVIGDGRKYLVALVCPNFSMLHRWARGQGIQWDSDAELAAHPEVVRMLDERVQAVNADLARFEQIKKFAVVDHEFSQDTGELTPTAKVKRRAVDSVYADVIEPMYA